MPPKHVFLLCIYASTAAAQGREKRPNFERWSAPNYGVKMNMTLGIDAVSDLRTKEMEFDVRLIMIEQASLNDLTCAVYLRSLPRQMQISAPRRDQTVFVPTNSREKPPPWKKPPYYFPKIFFKEARKIAFISQVSTPKTTRYTNISRNGVEGCDPLYLTKRTLTIACSLEFEDFPLDRQTCRLTLMSFSYSREKFDMNWNESNPLLVNTGIRLTEFSLKVTRVNCSDELINQDEAAATLCLDFTFERDLTYQIINTFVPSFFLVVASLGVFLMDPKSASERTTLSINALLALFIIYGRTRQSLPPSGSLTYADIWLIGCLLFALLVVMDSCVVELISQSETERRNRKKNQNISLARKDDLQCYMQEFESRFPHKRKSQNKTTSNDSIPNNMTGKRRDRMTQGGPISEVTPFAKRIRDIFSAAVTTKRVDFWSCVLCVGGFTLFTLAFWVTVVKKSFMGRT